MYEILLTFSTNGGDWKKAFYQVIPPRKLPSATSGNSTLSLQEVEGQQQLPLVSVTQALPNQTTDQDSNTDSQSQNTSPQPSTSQAPSQSVSRGSDHEGTDESTSDSNVSGESRDGSSNLNISFEDDIHSQLEPHFQDFD